MKRVVTSELLDSDSGTPAEIAASLADLRMFNRWFGGVSTTLAMVQRIAALSSLKQISIASTWLRRIFLCITLPLTKWLRL